MSAGNGASNYVGAGPADDDVLLASPSGSGIEAADRLQSLIERAGSWPIWQADRTGGIDTGTYAQVGNFGKSMRDIALWVAMRENDREALVELTNWERDRPLHVDPLAERISTAYSDLLYGDEPTFVAATESDQDNMDEMTEETALPSELKRWTDMSVSEGEVWWKSWTDLEASEWPLVSGHSRLNVLPLFTGRKLVAAAFVDNVLTQKIRVENQISTVYWRHIEIHAMGHARNLLYKGTVGQLGDLQPLTALPETANLEDEWNHGLPIILAGRVPNKLGRDFRVGVSEFQGVRDLLMDLNEARTIMAENARLVLKARMLVPSDAIGKDGNFDAGKDVIAVESVDDEMGGKNSGPYAVLEYNFRSNELIQHKHELTLDILARCGLAEQFVQETRGGGGQAFTGTALRTRLIPTLQAASGKARMWDKEVPRLLQALALLSALPIENGGCGKIWANAGGKHVQNRASHLPEDENEEVQRHVMAVQGEVESVQTAVEEMHEDWDEERVKLEVTRIRADRSVGPTATDEDETAEDLEKELDAANQPLPPPGSPDIPNVPPGGPGSAVPTPGDVVGSRQPGARQTVDGQSPGNRPPQVKAGGPK